MIPKDFYLKIPQYNRKNLLNVNHLTFLQMKQECIPVGCVMPAAVSVGGGGVWPSIMAFCCGLLLCSFVMAFWFGGLLIEGGLLVESGLLLWPSGMAFWLKGLEPRRPYQKAAFNQKTTK